MKINVILLAFILITFSVFKAAILPNQTTQTIEAAITPPTVDFNNVTTAFNKVGTCSGFTSCIEAFASAAIKLFYFIGQLFIALFWVIVDILLLAVLFLQIGFSPIPTAPTVVNVIIVGTFTVMLLVAVISFIPGED